MIELFRRFNNPLNSPHWREIPLARLRDLGMAMFLTSASIGLVLDAITASSVRRGIFPIPIVGGLLAALMFGAAVTVQLYLKLRPYRPKLLTGTGWTLYLIVFGCYLAAVARKWPELSPKIATFEIVADCLAVIFGIISGYTYFLSFINSEGMLFARADTELRHAYRIQMTLVPPVKAKTELVEVYGRSSPSEQVGGDLVDVVNLRDSSVFAYLADISGHGLNAGILMGMYKTAIRVGLQQQLDAGLLLESVNQVMPVMKEPAMYATCACLHFKDGRIEYALAGHPPVLHYRAAEKQVDRLKMQQFPLGLLAGARFEVATAASQDGDLFVIASDGVLEAANSAGEELGLERLANVVREHSARPLSDIHQSVMDAVRLHGNQEDDQSLLLARICGNASAC